MIILRAATTLGPTQRGSAIVKPPIYTITTLSTLGLIPQQLGSELAWQSAMWWQRSL